MIFTKEQLINQAREEVDFWRERDELIPSQQTAIRLRLAEITLAALTSEPVAWRYRTTDINGVPKPGWVFSEEASLLGLYQPLYASPPVAVVPDALERLRSIVADPRALPRRKEWISGQQYSYVLLENVEAMVDDACRAAMLQGAEHVQEWIPCSERMPENSDAVLVCQEGGIVFCAEFDGGGFYPDEFPNVPKQGREITHWMPLPAAPQQEVKP